MRIAAARAVRMWLYRVPTRGRLPLLAGLIIRVAAVVMVGYVLPMVWHHLPHPGWSLLLAITLAAKDGVVIWWWIRAHRLDPRSLWLDLPVGVAALVVGTALTTRHGSVGWLLYVYPYTVLITVGVGLTCRRLIAALASASLWGAALVASLVLIHGDAVATTLPIASAYLVNSCVGWGCGRLLRRNADELEAARAAAVRAAAALAMTEQRTRLSTALHDRILQTLETLSRGGALRDEALRQRTARTAAWLRRYVETGRSDQSEDVAVGLDAAARAAQQTGLAVELNDARLRAAATTSDGLGREQRDALVEAAFQTINAFGSGVGSIVVRATPDQGGVLVTVLSSGGVLPDPFGINDARIRLDAVGGHLRVDTLPYAELWIPGEPPPAAVS